MPPLRQTPRRVVCRCSPARKRRCLSRRTRSTTCNAPWSTLWEAPRSRARLWLRQGLAALERPGASTISGIVALGLGVVALLGMFLVERRLSAELAKEFPRDAPTAFLIDIQPDQWPGVEALLKEQQSGRIDSVPMTVIGLRPPPTGRMPVASPVATMVCLLFTAFILHHSSRRPS